MNVKEKIIIIGNSTFLQKIFFFGSYDYQRIRKLTDKCCKVPSIDPVAMKTFGFGFIIQGMIFRGLNLEHFVIVALLLAPKEFPSFGLEPDFQMFWSQML